MSEWKEVKLGDFIEFNPTESIKKGVVARKITMDMLIAHSKTIHSYIYEPYNGGSKFRNGDTIMARITPCLENGKHAFISLLEENEVAYGSTEYIVLRGIKDVSDNDFVYYLSKTPKFKDTAIKSMVGSSGRQRAQVDTLINLAMSVPSCIETQRRIAAILSSLDAKIENNNKVNAKLEEIAQNLFKEWFVDFGPFKDGKFVDSELGPIPEGWRVGRLGEIAEVNPSRSLKKGMLAKYLDMKNMPTSGPFPTNWEHKVYSGGAKFCNGDTLMARITPCLENGKVSYVNFLDDNEIGFGSTEYIVITTKSDFFPELFYFLCREKNFTDYAVANMNGSSGRQRVSCDSIKNYRMPIPPIHILEKLSPIKSIMVKIKLNSLENKRLATLRDTLLPKLMSGEIEV